VTTGRVQSRPASGTSGSDGAAEVATDDLSRAESVAVAIRRAFPLPQSGAFADLLAALEDEPRA
jgi:hypothetical protein